MIISKSILGTNRHSTKIGKDKTGQPRNFDLKASKDKVVLAKIKLC